MEYYHCRKCDSYFTKINGSCCPICNTDHSIVSISRGQYFEWVQEQKDEQLWQDVQRSKWIENQLIIADAVWDAYEKKHRGMI